MLVLSRKRSERIILYLPDQVVRLRVVAIEGNRVRLGVEAPPDVKILREEMTVEHGTDRPDGFRQPALPQTGAAGQADRPQELCSHPRR